MEFRLSPPTPVVAERVFGRTGHLPEAAVNEPVFATVVAASRIQESVRGASRAAAPLRVETFEPRTSLQSHIYIVTVLGLVESLGILLVCYSGRYVFIGHTNLAQGGTRPSTGQALRSSWLPCIANSKTRQTKASNASSNVVGG